MYGKTLADFPERFDEFLDEFRSTSPSVLDEAFRLARGVCDQFPTPADVRRQIANVPPQKSIQDAYERRKAQIMAQPAPKLLKSVLDEEKPKPREVRELSEAELESRLEELRFQAANGRRR